MLKINIDNHAFLLFSFHRKCCNSPLSLIPIRPLNVLKLLSVLCLNVVDLANSSRLHPVFVLGTRHIVSNVVVPLKICFGHL